MIHKKEATMIKQMKDDEFDADPWTDEEMELLAWEAGKHAGWEEMDEYDHYPSQGSSDEVLTS
jgi:hypothetical protein